MTGRPPKPTELHRLQGTYNATKHGRDRRGEPVPGMPLCERPPPGLTARERVEWRKQVALLPRGVAKQLDAPWLVLWCRAAARHLVASRALEAAARADPDHPYQIAGARGGWQPHPLVGVIAQAEQTMRIASAELGFSPSARTRIRGVEAAVPPADAPPRAWRGVKMKLVQT